MGKTGEWSPSKGERGFSNIDWRDRGLKGSIVSLIGLGFLAYGGWSTYKYLTRKKLRPVTSLEPDLYQPATTPYKKAFADLPAELRRAAATREDQDVDIEVTLDKDEAVAGLK